MSILSLPFSVFGRPSVKGSLLDTVRQPQASPSGTLVLPVGAIAAMAFVMVVLPAVVVTSCNGVIAAVVHAALGPSSVAAAAASQGFVRKYFRMSAWRLGTVSVSRESIHQLLV